MSNSKTQVLSVIIPVFNERETVRRVVDKARMAELPVGWEKEIIIVDDGSTDGTREILKSLNDTYKIIYRDVNEGKGAALKDGLAVAKGDYIVIQDADAEYDPGQFAALLRPIIEEKTSVSFGSRMLSNNFIPLNRIYFYGGLLLTKIFNFLFKTKITDIATCYKVFPRKYIPLLIQSTASDFVFDVIDLTYVLVQGEGFIYEVPIRYDSRKKSEGKKLNWKHGWRCFRRILSTYIFLRLSQAWSSFKEKSSLVKLWAEERPKMTVFLVFSFFFLVFFATYFWVNTVSSSDDHFFHLRFAEEMLKNGFFSSFQDFNSIYFSRMAQGNEYFMYYNFLFYLLVIPFSVMSPLYLGIKLYAIFSAAAGFTLLYWCLRRFAIINPLAWTIFLMSITSTTSLWRFFLSRPYTLAPSLLVLLIYFLYRRNHLGVFVVSFAYLYWHSSTFFFPIIVAIAYFLAERFFHDRGTWRNVAYCMGGTVAAIICTYLVSSGFLLFIKDTIFNIYWETILGKAVQINEGQELYPIDFFDFVQGNAVMFAVFVTSLSIDIFSYIAFRFGPALKEQYYVGLPVARRHLQIAMLILSAGFFLGTVSVSARFGDFFTFFAGVYIALSFDYTRRLVTITGQYAIRFSLVISLILVLVYLTASNLLFLQRKLAFGTNPLEMFQVGVWLERNTKPGDVVFINNWGWFPQLYYWSPNNYYISGLEPRFMYNYSPDLYWKSVHIPVDSYVCGYQECAAEEEQKRKAFSQGSSTEQYALTEGDKMAESFRNDFKTNYVVSSTDFRSFNYIMDHNENFERKIYNEAFGYYVFEVKDKEKNRK